MADRKNVFGRFLDLQEALGMESVPQRLEAFDVSHTGGTEDSCVLRCLRFEWTLQFLTIGGSTSRASLEETTLVQWNRHLEGVIDV